MPSQHNQHDMCVSVLQEETPLEEAKRLSEELGNTILLKREDLQPVHSFKVRGAFNRMSQMTEEQMQKGVICASAGNHAQGVALAALKLVPFCIFSVLHGNWYHSAHSLCCEKTSIILHILCAA